MNLERWIDVKNQVKQNFQLLDEYTEDLEPGQAEVLEFIGPLGQMQLKYVTRPAVLDKKTTYSNRIGSGVKVDYLYSDTETSSHLEIYQWSDSHNEWQKMDNSNLFT